MQARKTFFLAATVLASLFLVFFVATGFVSAVTNVSACANLSIAGMYYVLNQSVSSASTCFNVTANNVALDCGYYGTQYGITGTGAAGSYGVYLSGRTNVTVKNCLVKSFYYGVYATTSSHNGTYANNNASLNVRDGFLFASSSNNSVANNTAMYNSVGVEYGGFDFSASSYNNLVNNTALSNGCDGFDFISSNYNNVTNNTAANQVDCDGFYLESSSNNSFADNTANENGAGFDVYTSSNNSLANNTANNNDGYGFYFAGSSNNLVASNAVNNNSFSGIAWNSELNITVTGNRITASGVDATGLYSLWSNYSAVSGNTVSTTGSGESYAVRIRDSYWSVVRNGVFSASYAGVPDVYVRGAGTTNLTNCTFNKSDTAFEAGAIGGINVFWFVEGRVTDNNGVDLPGAYVNASNVNGSSVFNAATNATGWIPRQTVLEYWQNITGVYNATPHWFNASLAGYATNYSQTVVSGNSVVTRALFARSVDLVTPADGASSSSYAQNFCFSVNSTRALVNASLLLSGGVSASVSNSSALVNASSNCIAYSFIGPGNYFWSVVVYDSGGSIESGAFLLVITNPVVGGGGGSTPTPTPTPTPTATSSLEPSFTPTEVASNPESTFAPSPLTASPTARTTASSSAMPSISNGEVVSRASAENALARAQALLVQAQGRGIDSSVLSEARDLLDLAQKAFSNGDYAGAQSYAGQAESVLNSKLALGGLTSAAGFDWMFAGGAAVIVLVLAGGAAYWFYSRKRGSEL